MEWNVLFFLNSALLGVGLAMDAFSVSLANGLNEPHMKKSKSCGIAGVFGFLSGIDAYDRMDLRSHNRRVFPCIRKIYPMDCPDSSCLYRWKVGG